MVSSLRVAGGYASETAAKGGRNATLTAAEVWQAAGDDVSSTSQPAHIRELHASLATMSCEMLSLHADDVETVQEIPLTGCPVVKHPCPDFGREVQSISDSPTRVSSFVQHDLTGGMEAQAAVHAFNACTQTLDALWNDIGTPSADRSAAMSELWANMSAVFKSAIEKEKQKHGHLMDQLSLAVSKAKQLEQKLCWTPSVADTLEGPLVSQVSVVKAHTHELGMIFDERMSLFKLLHALHEDLGSKGTLPIPTDTSLIVKVTEDEIDRCIEVINESALNREDFLKAALEHETAEVERLCAVLKIKESEKADFDRFLSEVLQHDGESSVKKVTRLAVVQLHRTLQAAPDKVYHPGKLAALVCGCEQLQEALNLTLDKKDKLLQEHQDRIALQVSETKFFLKSLWQEYFNLTTDPAYAKDIIEKQRPIPDVATESNLTLVEGEVLEMEQKIESVKSIVAALRKRDEILKEKASMDRAAQDKDRLTDRSKNMAQVLIREEKVRNAIKKELPKIDKQLAQFCETYRAANGNQPFFYNGANLEAQLTTGADGTALAKEPRRSRSPAVTTAMRRSTTAASPGPTKKPRDSQKAPTRSVRTAR
ncbi:Anaphase spindle elongation protein 1 [Diplonema papillatum]|nr:Anaphase spindle elongation protein 1 [Diplonema papillatum]